MRSVSALPKNTTLCIGDLHFPMAHPDVFDFLKAAKEKFKPTKVVSLGDEIDAHALSDYVHDPDGHSAGKEHELALVDLHKLYKIFPKVSVCTSNHTERPFKRAYKAGIPSKFLRSYAEILEAPKGWSWADHWIIDGIRYEHGESYGGRNGAIISAEKNMRSTVIGHIHSFAGIQYFRSPEKQIFGFNVGCLIDEKQYSFAYARTMKARPCIGVGVIDTGVPQWYPMEMDRRGRWTGRI